MSTTAASISEPRARSSPVRPSAASCTSCPLRSSRWRSMVRASSLSSTISTRRRTEAPPGAGASAAAARGGVWSGKRTVNTLPRPGPSLATSMRPPCRSTSRFTRVRPMPSPAAGRWSAGVALHEQVEDPGQEIGGEPGAGVLHAEHGLAVAGRDGDGHPAIRRRELHRIAEEVVEDLLEPGLVGLDPHRSVRLAVQVPRRRGGGCAATTRRATAARSTGAGRA